MSHSVKIDNQKETVYSSIPTINAKAIEENSRVELVPIYRMTTDATLTYDSIGLIEGKTYVAKSNYGVESIKAVYDETNGMIGCNSSSGLFYIGDTKSWAHDGWFRECVGLNGIVLFDEKSIPFATIHDTISLGIENAKVGQKIKVKSINNKSTKGTGDITELEAVDDPDTSALIVIIDNTSSNFTCSHTFSEIKTVMNEKKRFVIGYTNRMFTADAADGTTMRELSGAYLSAINDSSEIIFSYFDWDNMVKWKVIINSSNNIEVNATKVNIA